MQNRKPETWNVQEAANAVPGARETFAANRISATTRQTLAHATAATSSSLDEIMAVIAYRMRRNATQVQPTAGRDGAAEIVREAELVA